MLEYIKKLFTRGHIYLGLLFFVDKLMFLIFDININILTGIPDNIKYTLLIVIVFYATYKVWEDEKHEKLNILNGEKDLILIIDNIQIVKNILKKAFVVDHDIELEIQINYLISKLKTLYLNNYLDENLKKVLDIEVNKLIERIENTKFKKSTGYDVLTSNVSFEIVKESKEKYNKYLKNIKIIIKK